MVKDTQTICRQKPTICLNLFDHFVGLAYKGLALKTKLESEDHLIVSFYIILNILEAGIYVFWFKLSGKGRMICML